MEKKKTALQEFARYTTMNVFGMIGLSCYILADTFFVARGLGPNGLTALNLAIPIYSFVHGSGLMLGIGGATKYSVFRGQQSKKNANIVFTHTVCIAASLAVLFVLVGLLFSGQITKLLGADAAVYEMTRTYLKVILLFSPFFILNDVFICFVRNDGDPELAMQAMLFGSFANIVMDYIFIFPMGMGILGAVLATGAAPIISMCMMLRHKKPGKYHFHFQKTRAQRLVGLSIVSLGFPSLVTEVSSGIVMIVFNFIILSLSGNIGVAAYGVIANIYIVVISIYTGIAQGMQPLTSRAFGVADKKRIGDTLRYAMITMLAFSVLAYGMVYIFADPITAVFNSEHNQQLQEIAVHGLRIYFAAIPFVGCNIIMAMLFSSTERAIPAQLISLLRGLVIIIPVAFVLSHFFQMTGVWMTLLVTEALVALLSVILYWFSRKNKV